MKIDFNNEAFMVWKFDCVRRKVCMTLLDNIWFTVDLLFPMQMVMMKVSKWIYHVFIKFLRVIRLLQLIILMQLMTMCKHEGTLCRKYCSLLLMILLPRSSKIKNKKVAVPDKQCALHWINRKILQNILLALIAHAVVLHI